MAAAVPVLSFRESPLSPWAQDSRARPSSGGRGSSLFAQRFRTVGSLEAVGAQVSREGLEKRIPLPQLVVEAVEEEMPPKRRMVAGKSLNIPRHSRAKHSSGKGGVGKGAAAGGGGGGPKKVEQGRKPKYVSSGSTLASGNEEEAEANKTSLIELATYPGFTPTSPTPLPQGLDALQQMKRVTRAQAKLATKREGYRDYWRENFYSPASQIIFLDTFWWFFLERYQHNRSVQAALFSRVSENYVKFLATSEMYTWKDKFLKAYPDAIAQCVYTAFIHAFPASWSAFDEDFKSALLEVVYLWQAGIKPSPNMWKRWDFKVLDPPNSLQTIGREDQTLKSPRQTNKFDLDQLVEGARETMGAELESVATSEASDTSSSVLLGSRLAMHVAPPTPPGGHGRQAPSQKQIGDQGEPELRIVESQLKKLREESVQRTQQKDGKGSSYSPQDLKKVLSTSHSVPDPKRAPTRSLASTAPPSLPKNSSNPPQNTNSPTTLPSKAHKPQSKNVPQHPPPIPEKEKTTIAGKQRQGAKSRPLAPGPRGEGRGGVSKSVKRGKTESPTGGADKSKEGKSNEKTCKEKALQLREKSRQQPLSILQKLQHEETPMALPPIDHVCFDLHGQSPLVKHYLQRKKLERDSGYKVLTKRSEVTQSPPAAGFTYEEVIRSSAERSKQRSLLFTAHRRESRQKLQKIAQQRLQMRSEYKEKLRILLSAQKEVESLSNELVAYWESQGVDRKQGIACLHQSLDPDTRKNIASYINKAFQRFSSDPA